MKLHGLIFSAFLLSACSMESTSRSDKPLTRREAERKISQTLPASASEVYYLFHSGGLQDLESYLRFHVDPAEADRAIAGLIAENNATFKRTLPYVRIAAPPPQPAKPFVDPAGRFKPISWWQPQTIRRGYSRAEQQSYALRIWYDEDSSIVYVYQND